VGPVGPDTPLISARKIELLLEKFVVPVPPESTNVTGTST
jgi:hypothetical protein